MESREEEEGKVGRQGGGGRDGGREKQWNGKNNDWEEEKIEA